MPERSMPKTVPLTGLLVLILSVACPGGDAIDPSDAGLRDPGPGADGGADPLDRTDVPGVDSAAERGDAGDGDPGAPPAGACAHGVLVCPKDQGCRDDRCGPCQEPADCRPLQGCLPGGRCGDCGQDDQCDAGRVCRHGYCLRPALPVWSLAVAPADLQRIVANPYDEIVVPCSLAVDDATYEEGCEVRIHGGTSRDYPKKSFRIEFSEGAPHPGYARKLTLRAEYNDASMLRNFLSHEFFRQATSVPAARAHHVWLRINGSDHGVMLLVERVGQDFLEGWGRSREAPTYECDPPPDLMRLGSGSFVPLPDAATYQATYDRKTDAEGDGADLATFIEDAVWKDWLDSSRLLTSTRRTAPLLAMDAYLEYLAALGVLQEHDHVRKNYYLSWQDDGTGTPRWEFYPTDLDMTFGCLWDEAAQDVICDSLITDEAWDRGLLPDAPAGYPVQAFYNQLIQQVLRDPALRPRFDARICALLDGPFWTDGLPRLIDAMEETLAAPVAADAKDRNPDEASFHAAVSDLRLFVTRRTAFLKGQIACP
jgi:hypothetical protein